MVPHHSRLTSQPILASLFPSYFCNNSREPSPWPVLPAMPISKPIVSTLTIYSRAGQWSRFQLSCMGCEWGKRKKKKWVLFFTKRTGQAKTRFSWSIIIIVEVITNTKYVFFLPQILDTPFPGKKVVHFWSYLSWSLFFASDQQAIKPHLVHLLRSWSGVSKVAMAISVNIFPVKLITVVSPTRVCFGHFCRWERHGVGK